ncbi:uncharacterized protein TNCV_1015041 [Trichonephila clavipes]|uniref:Uncharacterized protein n=1 Tax=Trichonephila clavipes TaxID=2585209 RepID=A0A8X6VY00_TRICX|nr:uncharacterized protein TNCV_1015041 [Trichonephila clavipes]
MTSSIGVAPHATASRSHFSTRQCSASHGKGVTRLSPQCYYPSLACLIRRFVSIEHIRDHLGRRVGHSMSLNELEARLQQIWNEMSQDIIQNLYASCPIVSHRAFALEGVQQYIKSSVLLPFSLE